MCVLGNSYKTYHNHTIESLHKWPSRESNIHILSLSVLNYNISSLVKALMFKLIRKLSKGFFAFGTRFWHWLVCLFLMPAFIRTIFLEKRIYSLIYMFINIFFITGNTYDDLKAPTNEQSYDQLINNNKGQILFDMFASNKFVYVSDIFLCTEILFDAYGRAYPFSVTTNYN